MSLIGNIGNIFKSIFNNEGLHKEAPSKKRKVVIYTTCFVNFNKKNTGIAAIKVLKKNGVNVQHSYAGCCGMPYLEQANLKKVIEQARKISKELLVWIPNIIKKDKSLSRYENFEDYKNRSNIFWPL